MVGYYQAYKGSTQTPLIYANSRLVKKVYKGSELIYQIGFNPVTFNVSSSLQTFIVPLGVSKIHVDCVASKGFTASLDGTTGNGGKGGRVQCDLTVNSGDTFYIMVGDIPSSSSPSYNASDIRFGGNTLNNRIIVAGGGGSGVVKQDPYGVTRQGASGGAGGGLTGGTGENMSADRAGQGGTQSAGGLGAYSSYPYHPFTAGNGELGVGGTGAAGAGGVAGAGGAGYYGGGGAGCNGIFISAGYSSFGAGAGGGSSYTNASCSNVVHTQGYNDGAGYVTISFVE